MLLVYFNGPPLVGELQLSLHTVCRIESPEERNGLMNTSKVFLLVEIDQPQHEMFDIQPQDIAEALNAFLSKRLSYSNVVRVIPAGETITIGE